jgi:aldose sugar dehydrogenase
MKHIFFLFLSVGLMLGLGGAAQGQTSTLALDSTELQVTVLAEDLVIPWDLIWGPDGWIWFSQRDGHIKRLNPDTRELQDIYFIEDVFQSPDNSGLHGITLHPNFPLEPYVYASYTYNLYRLRMVRFTYDPARQTFVDSVRIFDELEGNDSHNGSRMIWGEDGKLYYCLGDAYRAHETQLMGKYNGKILRINADGSVPEDNPFPGSPIYSLGHRNPQGLAFGPEGRLYSSEHGTGRDDELNLIEPGRNYGWPNVQGYCNFPAEQAYCDSANIREPLLTWTPSAAPSGLAYYDHPAIPEWRGKLIQVFLKAGNGAIGQRMELISLSEDGLEVTGQEPFLAGNFGRLRDVLVAPDGRIFLSTSNRETNGQEVVSLGDDKIIELRNLSYEPDPVPQPGIPTVLRVIPNPVKQIFLLEFPVREGEIVYHLQDLAGRRLRSHRQQLSGYQVIGFREGLPSGLYLLTVEHPDGQRTTHRLQFE